MAKSKETGIDKQTALWMYQTMTTTRMFEAECRRQADLYWARSCPNRYLRTSKRRRPNIRNPQKPPPLHCERREFKRNDGRIIR